MRSLLPLFLFLVAYSTSYSQNVKRLIKEKNVKKIMYTLASDNMMGRPASNANQIEPATHYLESAFKKSGLLPMKGANSLRQEFSKTKVSVNTASLKIDGKEIPAQQFLVYSDLANISTQEGLLVSEISSTDPFTKARSLLRDTISRLVFVDGKFEKEFHQLAERVKEHFTNQQTSVKIFVLGVPSSSHYEAKIVQHVTVLKLTNVVGIIPGKTKPDEMVVFSAHYDHIGIHTPVNGDSICNGADDDASGTTAVLQLMRYFKKANNNARTLVFAAFTGEEMGLLGSQYFATTLAADQVIAMFNIEMIGKPSKWGIQHGFITGYERSDFGKILQENLTGTGFEFHPDPYTEQNLFYRSDNASLARAGVPAHTISTDQIDTDPYYHTVDDEIATLDLKNLTLTIRAIALSARSIVAGKDTPTRINKSEVR